MPEKLATSPFRRPVGTRTFTYRDDPASFDPANMALNTETISGLYTKTMTRSYGTGTYDKGKATGFSLGTEYTAGYHYDNTGRIERVTGPGLPGYGAVYSRLTGSELVEHLRYNSDQTTTLATTQRVYEPNRGLIASVENTITGAGGPFSKYAYKNDALARRTSVVMTGSAFSINVYDDDHHWQWGYNDRSELTDADRCEGTDPTANCTHFYPAAPALYNYEYDPIGNRVEAQYDGEVLSYDTNNLNQYTEWSSLHGYDSFDYDHDGNLTSDSGRVFTWDAENRLIRVEPDSPFTNAKKVEFAYDYMGRRVEMKVSTWTGSAWDVSKHLKFVYEGWNVVLVLNGAGSDAVLTKYTWGLDLSGLSGNASAGGIHGAGGVGGLLVTLHAQWPRSGVLVARSLSRAVSRRWCF